MAMSTGVVYLVAHPAGMDANTPAMKRLQGVLVKTMSWDQMARSQTPRNIAQMKQGDMSTA